MEEDLLSDLIEYRKSKDKGVVTASRGLLQLFREVNPGLLKKRERGKAATMGETTDMQVAQYGHQSGPTGIEGLELLEKHFKAMRKEANGGESDEEDEDDGEGYEHQEGEDEGGWSDWEMDSEGGSDSEGWENVSSDGEDFELSDSDDEERDKEKVKAKKATEDNNKVKRKRMLGKRKRGKGDTGSDDEVDSDDDSADEAEDEVDADADGDADETRSVVSAAPTDLSITTKKLSLLAQQKILTPADFALLNELKLKAAQDLAANGGGSAAKRKLAALEAAKKSHGSAAALDDVEGRFLTENEILGPRKKAKMDYEERMESIKKGREGRDKFGSNKGKQNKEAKSSSTNREKNKNKPIMMALQYVFCLIDIPWVGDGELTNSSDRVVSKKKASLRDKQIKLRASIDKRRKSKR